MCIKHPLGWFRRYMQRELVTSTGSLFHFSCMAFCKVFPSRGLPKYVKHHVTNSHLRDRYAIPQELISNIAGVDALIERALQG
jgi:hypothetical protein